MIFFLYLHIVGSIIEATTLLPSYMLRVYVTLVSLFL
jgi:hypothetical protein